MFPYVLLILFCMQYAASDDVTFQLISISIKSEGPNTDPYALMSTAAWKQLTLQHNGIFVSPSTSGDYRTSGFVITPQDGNATIVNNINQNWTIVYTSEFPDLNNRTLLPDTTKVNFESTINIVFETKGYNNTIFTNTYPKTPLNWKFVTVGIAEQNKVNVSGFPQTATVEFTYSVRNTTVTQAGNIVKKGNVAAVVAAVIEGVILFILLLIFLYWLCIIRPRSQAMAAFGAGFGGNDPYAANRNIGGGASAGPPAYNSSPIRVEMQDRTPPSSAMPATRPAGSVY